MYDEKIDLDEILKDLSDAELDELWPPLDMLPTEDDFRSVFDDIDDMDKRYEDKVREKQLEFDFPDLSLNVDQKKLQVLRDYAKELEIIDEKQDDYDANDRKILNSIENGVSNPDYDFDEYD